MINYLNKLYLFDEHPYSNFILSKGRFISAIDMPIQIIRGISDVGIHLSNASKKLFNSLKTFSIKIIILDFTYTIACLPVIILYIIVVRVTMVFFDLLGIFFPNIGRLARKCYQNNLLNQWIGKRFTIDYSKAFKLLELNLEIKDLKDKQKARSYIEKAYRNMSRKYHPDRILTNMTKEQQVQKFIKIIRAKEDLLVPVNIIDFFKTIWYEL